MSDTGNSNDSLWDDDVLPPTEDDGAGSGSLLDLINPGWMNNPEGPILTPEMLSNLSQSGIMQGLGLGDPAQLLPADLLSGFDPNLTFSDHNAGLQAANQLLGGSGPGFAGGLGSGFLDLVCRPKPGEEAPVPLPIANAPRNSAAVAQPLAAQAGSPGAGPDINTLNLADAQNGVIVTGQNAPLPPAAPPTSLQAVDISSDANPGNGRVMTGTQAQAQTASPAPPQPMPTQQVPAPAPGSDPAQNDQLAAFQKLMADPTVEGRRNDVYLDSRNIPTVGIGHKVVPGDNLKKGDVISDDRVDQLFGQDGSAAMNAARSQAAAAGITDPAFIPPLASVNFQLGNNWTAKFPRTWNMITNGQYGAAAQALNGTLWNKQTPNRVSDFQDALRALPSQSRYDQ